MSNALPYHTPAFPPSLPFADQRGGLKAMGVILILIGAVLGCLGALTPLSLLVTVPGQPKPMARDILLGAGMYLLMSTILITAGVGSLRAKRWSRPMVIIVSGTWTAVGTLGLISWLIVGPDIGQAMAAASANAGTPGTPATPMSAGAVTTMRVLLPILFFVFGVALPGGFFWFYVRQSVRQTVEYFDPIDVWTDQSPTPILALSTWLWVAAAFAAISCLWAVFPWFGRLLSGTPAVIALAALGSALAILATGVFQLHKWAWVGTLLLLAVFAASALMTYARVDPLESYRLSGMPPAQVEQLGQMNMVSRSASMFNTSLYAVAALAYLLWVWKYFHKRPAPPAETGSSVPPAGV
jgi:hypothetical protein